MNQLNSLIIAKGNIVFSVLVFFSVVLVTLAISNLTVNWAGIRRRTTSVNTSASAAAAPAGRLVNPAYTGGRLGGLFMPVNEASKPELTRFLNSSGYYGNGIVAIFQTIRLATAVGFGLAAVVLVTRLYPHMQMLLVMGISVIMILLGYMLPRSIVSMRRDRLMEEHRIGFPDFLDLLVICVEAGIGIDSALERVGKDLSRSYPSLSRNLGFMSLELRAGRSTREALENLSSRLGIEEARSFATLIQQSEELGSSLVQSLRVYSNEMRQKRLMRAEEKAGSLPVKMVLPLALFIFPVILGVTLMPVALKLYQALKIH